MAGIWVANGSKVVARIAKFESSMLKYIIQSGQVLEHPAIVNLTQLSMAEESAFLNDVTMKAATEVVTAYFQVQSNA